MLTSLADVSVDSATWNQAYTKAVTRFGKPSQRPVIPTQYTSIKVDSRGILRAKEEVCLPQRNVLSKLQWDHLQKLRKDKQVSSGSLRLRRPQRQQYGCVEPYAEELEIMEADREIDLVRRKHKTYKNRKALARNLGLLNGTHDEYGLISEIEGHKSSGLYAAAGNDKALEKAVHDISATVYGARPGVLRMPLKCPTSKFAKDRPPMLSRKESIDDNLPWEVYEPLKTTIETTTTRYPTGFEAPKRNARELVQQETYRADNKRKGIADRPTQVGDHHIQRETLKPHSDGMQLDHIDKRIYGEVKPKKHVKAPKKTSAKRCMPFGET